MGKKKSYRKQLEGQRTALEAHLAKIAEERAKPRPDEDLIRVWEKTIENIKHQITKLERRLKR